MPVSKNRRKSKRGQRRKENLEKGFPALEGGGDHEHFHTPPQPAPATTPSDSSSQEQASAESPGTG